MRTCASGKSRNIVADGGYISFIILADAHFSHDIPRNSVLDLPFARCRGARELGSAPPNRRAITAEEPKNQQHPVRSLMREVWKDAFTKAEAVSKKTVPAQSLPPQVSVKLRSNARPTEIASLLVSDTASHT